MVILAKTRSSARRGRIAQFRIYRGKIKTVRFVNCKGVEKRVQSLNGVSRVSQKARVGVDDKSPVVIHQDMGKIVFADFKFVERAV